MASRNSYCLFNVKIYHGEEERRMRRAKNAGNKGQTIKTYTILALNPNK
jgi:hypothetical protein